MQYEVDEKGQLKLPKKVERWFCIIIWSLLLILVIRGIVFHTSLSKYGKTTKGVVIEIDIGGKVVVVSVVVGGEDHVGKTVTVKVADVTCLTALGQHFAAMGVAPGVFDDVKVGMLVIIVAVGDEQIHIAIVVDIKAPDPLQNAFFRNIQILSGVSKGALG